MQFFLFLPNGERWLHCDLCGEDFVDGYSMEVIFCWLLCTCDFCVVYITGISTYTATVSAIISNCKRFSLFVYMCYPGNICHCCLMSGTAELSSG